MPARRDVDAETAVRAAREGLRRGPRVLGQGGDRRSASEAGRGGETAAIAARRAAALTSQVRGAGKPPGPEASLLKIKGVELQQAITELLLEAIGNYGSPYIREAMDHGWNEPPIGPEYAAPIAPHYFNWRKSSIYGGSNEVQRGIIAKMVLGL